MWNIFLFALILNTGCMITNKQNYSSDEKMVLAFQDFFDNDTVSVKVNHCTILKDKLLKSDEIIGYTRIILTVNKANKVFLGSNLVSTNCSVDLKEKNSVTIILNGNETVFEIDLAKGAYIGFDKKDKGLYLIQSKIPFEYD